MKARKKNEGTQGTQKMRSHKACVKKKHVNAEGMYDTKKRKAQRRQSHESRQTRKVVSI